MPAGGARLLLLIAAAAGLVGLAGCGGGGEWDPFYGAWTREPVGGRDWLEIEQFGVESAPGIRVVYE